MKPDKKLRARRAYRLADMPFLLRTPLGRRQLRKRMQRRSWRLIAPFATLHRRLLGRFTRVVAVIGDSTFVHAGIPPLIDAVYNGSNLTLIILDNSATGMTGGQPHPASGQNALGQSAPKLDLVALCKSTGVDHVTVVDTWQRKEMTKTIRKALAYPGPAVVVAQGPCMQLPEMKRRDVPPFVVHEDLCTQCDACFKVWCPAITRTDSGFPRISGAECTSCTVCAQVCPTDAICLEDQVVSL